jgi:hypothetical protein
MNENEMRATLERRRASAERGTDLDNPSASSIYQQESPEDDIERARRMRGLPFGREPLEGYV